MFLLLQSRINTRYTTDFLHLWFPPKSDQSNGSPKHTALRQIRCKIHWKSEGLNVSADRETTIQFLRHLPWHCLTWNTLPPEARAPPISGPPGQIPHSSALGFLQAPHHSLWLLRLHHVSPSLESLLPTPLPSPGSLLTHPPGHFSVAS